MARASWKHIAFIITTMVLVTTMFRQTTDYPDCANTSISKEAEMQERTMRMRKICSQYPARRQLNANLYGKLFYISDKYKLSYCRVAKVGSTFWTQVFMTLAGIKPSGNGKGEVESMFEMPRDESHMAMKTHPDLTMEFHDKRVHSTTSFMVSRNPYSRLFSSYIDQIYLPNKWSKAAGMVSEIERQKCGSDVTFDEFLSAISKTVITKKGVDLHWAPVFSICLPCDSNLDVIAKQETFKEDAEYILNLVGVEKSIRDEVDKAIGKDIIENSLSTLVHTYVTKGHNVKDGCISEQNLAKRLWTAFQIQGYLHNDSKFPAEKFKTISPSKTESVLLEAVLDAVSKRKLPSQERDAQRQAWKVNFWKDISTKTLELVQDAYYEDFYVFNYDLDPNTM